MNREQLLKRWNELAPGECEVDVSQYGTQVWVRHDGAKRFRDDPPTGTDQARLLLALIEAISARGWHYTLASYLADGTLPQ